MNEGNRHAVTHGLSKHPLYTRWSAMRARTSKTPASLRNFPEYANVHCDPRWATFQGFLSNPPAGEFGPGMALSRLNDSGDYSPENCRWVTISENCRQAVNRRWGNI